MVQLHAFLTYFVAITGAIAIVYEILQHAIFIPMIHEWVKSVSKDPDSPRLKVDEQKAKDNPSAIWCMMGCGCLGFIYMMFYYVWLTILLFIPGCFWFSLGLICLCVATWLSAAMFGSMSKANKIFGYFDALATVAVIALMINKMVG